MQLAPEAFIGPLVNRILQGALHVVAAAAPGSHAAQCESALVIGIDQLLAHRRGLRQDADPAERVDSLVLRDFRARHAAATDAVEAIAACDEVTANGVANALA